MADWTPPAEATPAAAWTPPPEAKPWTPPAEAMPADAKTTAPGLAASAARGLAPYAAGAGIGAAAGAPIGGVGAIPGAIAGMGAVGLTELGGGLYNILAPRIGTPQITTPQGATDRLMDAFGIRRPSTSTERMVEMAAGMLPAPGGITAAGQVTRYPAALQKEADLAKIDRLYRSAIKPTTVGKDSAAERLAGINEVVRAKGGIQYTNEAGNVIGAGRVPQTVAEATQAIDQAKASLFKEWDALARASGDAGGMVDVTPVVTALRQQAANPVLLRDAPEAAARASALAERYAQSGVISPLEAQEAIIGWNRRLKGSYGARPDSDTEAIGKAASNALREQLDKTIEATVAPGYQELKRRHGALLQIEKDVDRAERRIANREPGGGILGRMGSAAGLYDVAHGIFTGDIKHVLTGAAIKGGTEYLKRLHSPDRSIKNLFELAEKHVPPLPSGGGVPIPAAQGVIGGIQVPPTGPGMPAPAPGTPRPPGGVAVPSPAPPAPVNVRQPAVPMGGGAVTNPHVPTTGIGGSVVPGNPFPAVAPQPVPPSSPFVVPVGGGRVVTINPNDPIAKALGYSP